MRIIKQFLFTAVMIIGFSMVASAQQDKEKKKETPPKQEVIKIIVKEKDNDKPKENKEKKPTAYLVGYSENKPILYV